jgi:hypothetical protein
MFKYKSSVINKLYHTAQITMLNTLTSTTRRYFCWMECNIDFITIIFKPHYIITSLSCNFQLPRRGPQQTKGYLFCCQWTEVYDLIWPECGKAWFSQLKGLGITACSVPTVNTFQTNSSFYRLPIFLLPYEQFKMLLYMIFTLSSCFDNLFL